MGELMLPLNLASSGLLQRCMHAFIHELGCLFELKPSTTQGDTVDKTATVGAMQEGHREEHEILLDPPGK